MSLVTLLHDFIRDPRQAIAAMIAAGPLFSYGLIFVVIFVETGLVFFPFLPGDSLLFAAGIFAQGDGFNLPVLLLCAWLAAILGDTCNFMIGKHFGQRLVASGKISALTPERIRQTEDFLDKWGHIAIFLGRFFPIIRTFIPFIAGMGNMAWHSFVIYNIAGGICWSSAFVLLGFFFGHIPFVQDHFELLLVAIIAISLIPIAFGAIRSLLAKRA